MCRYAVSVIWTLDGSRSYHTKGVWFGRTVIRSCYKLAYEVRAGSSLASGSWRGWPET